MAPQPDIRRNPPVPQRLRFSATVPSSGLRNMPHGSQPERAITETSGNAASAPFGRSPPRKCLHQTHHFAALFQSRLLQGMEGQRGQQRIGGDEDMRAGDQHAVAGQRPAP